ncbi:MAG: pseudouridine synthase [Acutalibacteraceae bacterium]
MSKERLDKLIATQGMASRSDVRKMIYKGQVVVNGVAVKSPSVKVDTEKDVVEVDGNIISVSKYIYLMMNKPSGVVSATQDNIDKTVIDIIPVEYKRKGLFPVGRLDKDTEGLLIITDDGDFAHKVMSPNKKIYKTYVAQLDSPVDEQDIQAFANGIEFRDGTKCRPAILSVVNNEKAPTAQVKVCEGMFHQVKKMFAVRGKKVVNLKRIAIGSLKLDDTIAKGEVKKLGDLDINAIFIDEMH